MSLKTPLPLCMRCFISIPSWMSNMHYTGEISAPKLVGKAHLPGLHPQIVSPLAFSQLFAALACRQHRSQTCTLAAPLHSHGNQHSRVAELGHHKTPSHWVHTAGTGTQLKNSGLEK